LLALISSAAAFVGRAAGFMAASQRTCTFALGEKRAKQRATLRAKKKPGESAAFFNGVLKH